MPQSMPKVAQCEDYDSEINSVKPGTRKEARRRSISTRPPTALERYRTGKRDGTSDSGYSSHASGTQDSNSSATVRPAPAVQAPQRPATSHGLPRPKPILHRSDSKRSNDKAPDRSGSVSRQSNECVDPNCQIPACQSARTIQRSFSMSQQYPSQYAPQYTVSPAQYQPQVSQYPYQYAQVPQVPTNQNVPVLNPAPRPRLQSTPQPARPVSFHGYPFPNVYSNSSQGPPPSASAYQSMQYAAWLHQQQQQHEAYQQSINYGVGATTPTVPVYPQQSPVIASPTSATFSAAPAAQQIYATRNTYPSYPTTSQQPLPPNLEKTYATRRTSERVPTIPGAFPRTEDDSVTESSASEDSDEEYERDRRSRARDWFKSSSSTRRPSIKKQYVTAPIISRRLDTGLDYISSSDNVDSDRTARAVINRSRTDYTGSSRSSRRPSVSTTASSGKTKATTVSSTSGLANMTVERNGRPMTYYSKRDRDKMEYVQRRMAEYSLEDRAKAYQDDVRGPQPPELTTENMRQHQHHRRSSQSQYSGHSRRTSRSSNRVPDSGGIKIVSNGTTLHVYDNDPTVEVRAAEDGTQTFVISTAGGKTKTYPVSSGSSRAYGYRSHVSSDNGSRRRDTMRDDDGWAPPNKSERTNY